MNIISKGWQKIPVLIRAIATGMLVQIVGVFPVFILLQQNLQLYDQLPWSFVVGMAYLWGFTQYINGKGWPSSTADARKQYARFHPLHGLRRKWAILSGLFLGITLSAMVLWGWSFTEWPPDQVELIRALADTPLWTILPLLLMAAMATGIVEESAYRGYMQLPIERRHGPFIAIPVVALAFALSHPLPDALIPFFFFGSLGWGILTYLSGSNLPGIIVHTVMDLGFFTWGIFNVDVLESMQRHSVLENGPDAGFIVAVSVSIVSGATTIFCLIRLSGERAGTESIQAE